MLPQQAFRISVARAIMSPLLPTGSWLAMHRPFFSIVMPTYRRDRELAACLQSLTALDYPRDRVEIAVVDDSGDSPLDALVEPFQGALKLSVVRQPKAAGFFWERGRKTFGIRAEPQAGAQA